MLFFFRHKHYCGNKKYITSLCIRLQKDSSMIYSVWLDLDLAEIRTKSSILQVGHMEFENLSMLLQAFVLLSSFHSFQKPVHGWRLRWKFIEERAKDMSIQDWDKEGGSPQFWKIHQNQPIFGGSAWFSGKSYCKQLVIT